MGNCQWTLEHKRKSFTGVVLQLHCTQCTKMANLYTSSGTSSLGHKQFMYKKRYFVHVICCTCCTIISKAGQLKTLKHPPSSLVTCKFFPLDQQIPCACTVDDDKCVLLFVLSRSHVTSRTHPHSQGHNCQGLYILYGLIDGMLLH